MSRLLQDLFTRLKKKLNTNCGNQVVKALEEYLDHKNEKVYRNGTNKLSNSWKTVIRNDDKYSRYAY